MPVSSVNEIGYGDAERDASTSTIRRQFLAQVTVGTDPDEVLSDPGVPNIGDAHPSAPGYFASRKRARYREPAVTAQTIIAIVDYTRTTIGGNPDDPDGTANPLDQIPVIALETDIDRRPWHFEVDDDGTPAVYSGTTTTKPILNSAWDTYLNPPEREIHDLRWIITRNEALIATPTYPTFTRAKVEMFNGALNSSAFQSYVENSVKLKMRASFEVENNVAFARVTYELFVRLDDDWLVKILDEGFHELVPTVSGTTQERKRIVDEAGNPVTQPVALDGAGGRLFIPSTVGQFPQFEFNVYQLNRRANFNDLDLPTLPG